MTSDAGYEQVPGPVHEHYCEKCVYLKTILVNGKPVDLHFCTGVEQTPIARYGRQGDYISGEASANAAGAYPEDAMLQALAHALLIAKAKGLYKGRKQAWADFKKAQAL